MMNTRLKYVLTGIFNGYIESLRKVILMLLANSAKCLLCEDHIYSGNRHDFKSCACGNISVDGGMEYQRRSVKNNLENGNKSYIDTSIEWPTPLVESFIETAPYANGNNKNDVLKVFRDEVDRHGFSFCYYDGNTKPRERALMSVVSQESIEKAIDRAVTWTTENGRNKLGLICSIARELRDENISLKAKK